MQRCRDPAVLAQIRHAFEGGGDRRPPLQQWMASNFDELSAMLEDARPNWQNLAQAFMTAGFRNLDGSDLKAGSVRQTWYRVRQRKTARRSRSVTPAPTVEVLSPTQPDPPQPSRPPAQTPADDPMAALMAEMNRRSGRI
jgi:hypothetical protein